MNQLMNPNQENVYIRYSSTGIPIACVYGPWKPVPVPPKQARRASRLMKEHKLIGDSPPFPKPRVVDLRAWADVAKRKPVAHKPSSFRTVKARVIYTDADGSTVELEPASISVYDSTAIVGEAEVEVGSVSKSPAEDDSTMVGGSVLKRPRVDLGEASQVLVGNVNPGQDSSVATIGTIEEVKGGESVINKDLGGASEIVVDNLNPGSADPFVDAYSDT